MCACACACARVNACVRAQVSPDVVALLTTREETAEMLKMKEYIDLIIPRGSNEFVQVREAGRDRERDRGRDREKERETERDREARSKST